MNDVDTYVGAVTINPRDPEGERRAREHLVRDIARKLADKLADGNVYTVRIKIDGPHVEGYASGRSEDVLLCPRLRAMHGRVEIGRVHVEPRLYGVMERTDPRQMPSMIPAAKSKLWTRAKRLAGRLKFWRRG